MGSRTSPVCTVCDATDWAFVHHVSDDRYAPDEEFEVRHCRSCGLELTTRDGEPVVPWAHYHDDYGAFVAPASTRRRDRALGHVAVGRLAWLRDFDGRSRRVLDVGCGSGRLLATLRDAGHTVAGVEPNTDAVAAARAAGFDVVEGVIADVEGGDRFDLIVLSHVLEHVLEPNDVLADVRRLLAPGGSVAIALPNRRCPERRIFGRHWDGWDIPRHVHHFDPTTVTRLLDRNGFDVARVRFEVYGLFGRSRRNAGGPAWQVRILRLLDRPIGAVLALLRRSGAMQVTASIRDDHEGTSP